MAPLKGFIGPSYSSRSANADMEELINLFVEKVESGNGKTDWVLQSTPGLSSFTSFPSGAIRGLWVGENRLFCVAGSTFYEVFNTTPPTYTSRGTVADDGKPVQIFPNGNQVMVVSGGQVYIDTGTAFIQPDYTTAQGTVTVTAGGHVARTYGDPFDATMVGQHILINNTGYLVGAYIDQDHLLCCTTFPATGLGFSWSGGGLSGQCFVFDNGAMVQATGDYFTADLLGATVVIDGVSCTVLKYTDREHISVGSGFPTVATNVPFLMVSSGIVNINGKSVTYVSGDAFSRAFAGNLIQLNGVSYSVTSVDSDKTLTLYASAGVQTGVRYVAEIPVTASAGAFLDSYFIVATPSTRQVNISALNDGTHWDPADYANKEGYPDALVTVIADHEELWLLGSQTIEVWRNSGNADFPLQRNPSGSIQVGCGAKHSVVRMPGGIAWLSGDATGGPVAYRSNGYTPQRISTHAIEYRWAQYSTWTDAEAFSYEEQGHFFWQITFPTGGETWVWDLSTNTWHRRAFDTSLGRHRASCHAYIWGKHLVGDYQYPAIWVLSSEATNDAVGAIKRVRRSPFVGSEFTRQAHSAFRLECAYSANQTVTLSYSNNYGASWSTPRVPDGKIIANGNASRVLGLRWHRLGSFITRVYELVITGTDKVSITGADIEGS